MLQKRFAVTSLLLIAVMLALHTAATMFYWYVSIPWYDMMMHTLGGIFLGVFTAAIFTRHIKEMNRFEIIVTILLMVLIIGLGWEYFEYAVQYFIKGSARLADVADSVSDICCDMIGGVVGALFVLKSKTRYNVGNE